MALSDRRIGVLGQADIKHSSTDKDQIRKRKVEEAEMLFQTHIRAQLANITEEIRMKKMDKARRDLRYPPYPHWMHYRSFVQWSNMEISHLRSALYVLYGSRKLIPDSEKANSSPPTLLEELDDQVAKLQCRMRHGCKSNIRGENQLLREIKDAKLAKQRALADSIANTDMPRNLGSKGAIEDEIQEIVKRMKELKKKDMEYRTKVKNFQRQVERRGDEIKRLERKLAAINKKKIEI